MKIEIGSTVTESISAVGEYMTGTVVYIHPELRYYTAEFHGMFGKFRESFPYPLPADRLCSSVAAIRGN